jgi:hypothetical protein
MIAPFDIFRVDPEGPRWIEEAPDVEFVRRRMQELLSSSPAEYLVVSRTTGRKMWVKPSDPVTIIE